MEQTTQLEQIKELAWTLALASASGSLDIPGEYTWATPHSTNFNDVRARSQSIFSSGNSIKDATVRNFVQTIPATKYLLDCNIVKTVEDMFQSWLLSTDNYKLHNLDMYKYVGFSAGTQETFLNFYLVHRNKRFRVFKGDYWWHMELWHNLGLAWAYIEDDDIKQNDVCICSCPFALTGDTHPMLQELLNTCNNVGAKVLLDFIYLPNSRNAVDLDLSADCIDTITFSLSKTFPVQCAKIAVRMSKTKPLDPMQISNDENICNRVSAGIAYEILKNFTPDYIANKYLHMQEHWCTKLGLKQSKVVHFGIGDDYVTDKLWYSKFNTQNNRYNLGMLYENEALLKSLNLY